MNAKDCLDFTPNEKSALKELPITNNFPKDSGIKKNASPLFHEMIIPTLTDSIRRHTKEKLSKHSIVDVDGIQKKVKSFVGDIIKYKAGLIAFVGLPSVGKTGNVNKIQIAARQSLGFVDPQELFEYQKPDEVLPDGAIPDGTIPEVGGHVCPVSRAIVATLHADHFFGCIGEDRRTKMLSDIDTCSKEWGNERAMAKCIRDLLSGNETDVQIYMGSQKEKEDKMPLGSIEVKNSLRVLLNSPESSTDMVDSTKVIILEGVNVWPLAQEIQKKTNVKTMKILFNTSFEESLIRVLRRDHDKKRYSFQEILEHRLLEYFFILQLYILPALRDPETVLLEKIRKLPAFLETERLEILSILRVMKEGNIQDKQLTPEQRVFVVKLSSRLIGIFKKMKGVSEEQMKKWRDDKAEAKGKRLQDDAKELKNITLVPKNPAKNSDPDNKKKNKKRK